VIAKILVVEGESDVRGLCTACLGSIVDWTVLEASSGAEGIRMATEEHPDVILLDANMPAPAGLTMLAELRRRMSNVPVVLLTDAGMGPGYRALGAVGVIEKPLDAAALPRRVREVLDRELEQTSPTIVALKRAF
jgi:DNA-binding response OmpR family regulator